MAWEPQVRSGAETQSQEEFIRFDTDSTRPDISSTKARTGTYAIRMSGFAQIAYTWPTASNRVQVGAAFNHAGVSSSGNGAVIFELRAANNDLIARVRWDGSDDLLELHTGTTLLDSITATAAGFAAQDTWHEVGMQVHIANDETGFVSFYVNGGRQLHYSGAIAMNAAKALHVGGESGNTSNWAAYLYVDDIMLDTSTINEPDAAPPNVRLDYKAVAADSGTPEWTPVGTANNWDCVDEAPPDGDDTFVETDTNDDRDLYTFGGYTAPEGYVIEAVIPVFVARKTAASTAMQIEPVVYDGTNTEVGTAQDLPSTFGYIWQRFAEKPGGGAWGDTIGSSAAIGQDAVVP